MQRRLNVLSFALVSILLVAFVSACATSGEAALQPRAGSSGVSTTLPDRADCGAIGTSDLHSPPEGIWFQTHCLPASPYPQGVASTVCNRVALDTAAFSQVAPDLYVYRSSASSTAFLWLATTPDCFDNVSARVVTFICSDRTVSFKWDVRAACAAHGGVLARINGS